MKSTVRKLISHMTTPIRGRIHTLKVKNWEKYLSNGMDNAMTASPFGGALGNYTTKSLGIRKAELLTGHALIS